MSRICGEFFARLGGVIASHLFVFLLCNVIIATLLAKSDGLSAENLGANNAEDELYAEVVRNTENRQPLSSEDAAELSIEEIVYQDKEIISQVNAIDLETQRNLASDLDSDSDLDMDNPKSYRRSKSEKFVRASAGKGKRELRRMETEKSGKLERRGEKLYAQDDLSNEEFQRKVDEFIAKELEFRRGESLAMVLQSQA
ncbi:hypothetical protein SLEP1_g7967 [Rubroshorea leprosula]|uniref:Uncharacterized protein n=1 Tax=Rubroshorea leprosula TaxID=152421 RepID=A0AAV5I8F4_9ROSI|nr:hypothetical protein SLEP1_g7967 [Rubroshorea leprosula]